MKLLKLLINSYHNSRTADPELLKDRFHRETQNVLKVIILISDQKHVKPILMELWDLKM